MGITAPYRKPNMRHAIQRHKMYRTLLRHLAMANRKKICFGDLGRRRRWHVTCVRMPADGLSAEIVVAGSFPSAWIAFDSSYLGVME